MLPTHRTKRNPDRYTDGPVAGRVIARKTGKVTTRWQQYVLDVGLERLDGPGSPFAYTTIDLIVGRRCGKTIDLMGVPLFRALDGPVTLDNGRVVPFLGAHTAQNLVKARQRFVNDFVKPLQDSMSPAVWNAGVNFRQAIGDTSLTIDPAVAGKDWRNRRASTIQIVPPTTSSVRGDGQLHVGLDEILVHSIVRGQELMAAARPTLAEMRGHGQLWRASNVTTLNDSKTWLYQLRESGRADVKAGRQQGRAYFEFTIPDDVDPTDETQWPRYYPAINDGLIRIQELRADLDNGDLTIEQFAAEYLGRWPGHVAILTWSAIARTDWDAAATDLEQPDEGMAGLGVDIDPYGRSSSIVTATPHPDRRGVLVEVVEHGPGSVWVAEAVRRWAPKVDAVAIDDYGPGHDLLLELEGDEDLAGKLIRTTSTDFAAACYGVAAGLREHTWFYRKAGYHQALTSAASAAQQTSSKAWQWERRVPVSQTPLVAATLAPWALGRAPEPQRFFVY